MSRIKISSDNNTADAQNWERNTLEKLLMQVYREQRAERIGKWIWRGFLLLLLMAFLSVFAGGQDLSSGGKSTPHTAVIDLYGVISSDTDPTGKLLEGLQAAYGNPQVKGIIIRADSPGGSPVLSDIAFSEIRRMKAEHKDIPLYVVAEDICASGCYYVAAAADKIYASRASMVGSIGVIGGGFDMTGLIDKLGIERRLKTAGRNKGMGDPFTAETAEQQLIWQEMLDDIHAQFIEAVKLGRGSALKWQGNDAVFSGRVYTGSEAKNIGLIDDFGNVYTVSRDIIKAEDTVNYTPQEDFSRLLSRRLGAQARNQIRSFFQAAFE